MTGLAPTAPRAAASGVYAAGSPCARNRFSLLRDTTGFHGAYDSSAKRDVPEFRRELDFEAGARETLLDLKRRGVFRDATDTLYESMVNKALAGGVEPEEI